MQRFKLFQMLFLSLFVIGFTAGCDDDDDGNNNDSGGMVATVNGTTYNFDTGQSSYNGTIMAIAGADINVSAGTNRQLNITILNPAVGSYNVAQLSVGSQALYSEGSTGQVSTWIGVSGTITIDEISTSGAKGTFSFTGENQQDATTRVISNGSFDFDF